MARGGKRAGAGRPPGSKNKKSQALRDRLVSEGFDPAILVKACFQVAADPKTKPGEKIYAVATALPFLVPKLSAMDIDLDAELDGGVVVEILPARPKEGKKP